MNIRSAQIRILLLVFVLLTNTVLLAQVETVSDSYTDSTQSPNYMPVFEGLMMNYKTGNPEWQQVDTTLELFSDFDKAYNQRFYSATLGNIGQSHRVLDYEFEPFGIRFKKIPLPNYLYSEQNVPVFKPNSPYTVVSYVAGSNKHHLLHGVHAQEINNFSLGATFNVISCLGAYQQQRIIQKEKRNYKANQPEAHSNKACLGLVRPRNARCDIAAHGDRRRNV